MKKRGLIVTMLISSMLLLGFLLYWLNSVYLNEKQRMVLELKNQNLVNYIGTVRIPTNNLNPYKDLRLKNRDLSYTKLFSDDIALATDSIPIVINTQSQEMKIFHRKFDRDSTRNNTTINVKDLLNNYNKVSVKFEQVFPNILKEIGFAAFLLGSILSAFYLAYRSLRKEKELAIMRSDMVSNMSHELKTPISTIAVALEAIQNFNAGNDPVLRNEYINISKSEVERLNLLIDKTININAFEKGKFTYKKEIADIKKEVERILKILKIQFEKSKTIVSFNLNGTNFKSNIDKTHFANIIHNLIENAIKYSEPPRKINIDMEEETETILFRIQDNGIGIPKQYQSKIFDNFFRVPQGDQHNIKGHGLGLSYVKKVIKAHGGNIKMESEEGMGSTFILRLPKQ